LELSFIVEERLSATLNNYFMLSLKLQYHSPSY
jgi:hypothetical protein